MEEKKENRFLVQFAKPVEFEHTQYTELDLSGVESLTVADAERMVDEGVIAKYNIDAGSPACFEYLGVHPGEDTCYHCKCQVCGKLIHLHCEELPELQKHILEHHGFSIDPVRTIFYGVCGQCREEGK